MLTKLLNNMKLHNKFLIMYVFCVIIPLVITDAIVFYSIYEQEYNNRMYELENIANKYISTIESTVVYNARIARAICENEELNHFLDERYESKSAFFIRYYEFVSKSFFKSLVSTRSDQVTIFVDNPTIADSMYFKHMYKAVNGEWYQRFKETGNQDALLVFYDETADPLTEREQTFYYVRKMHLYDSTCDKLLRIDINSSELRSQLLRISSEYPMYVCNGDYVAFARFGEDVKNLKITEVEKDHKFEVHKVYSAFGTDLDIYIFSDELLISSIIMSNLWIIIILLIFTLIVPILLMKTIEKSLSSRIMKLEAAFNGDQVDKFQPIDCVEGSDEISTLMQNYNNIVSVNHSLINSLYKDKLKEQESDLSRKNAELLALQSQINPHFLYNTLDSISWMCEQGKNSEAVEMVNALARLFRISISRGHELIPIRSELQHAESYLEIQAHRYKNQFTWSIDAEESCLDYLCHKITLQPIIENAIYHGLNGLVDDGEILVSVREDGEDILFTVTDNGSGMTQEQISAIMQKDHSDRAGIGIKNVNDRLTIYFGPAYGIQIDSEPDCGTSVLIRMPKVREEADYEKK